MRHKNCSSTFIPITFHTHLTFPLKGFIADLHGGFSPHRKPQDRTVDFGFGIERIGSDNADEIKQRIKQLVDEIREREPGVY